MKRLLHKLAVFFNLIDPPTTKVITVKGDLFSKRLTFVKHKSMFIIEKELLSTQGKTIASNTTMIAYDDAKQLAKFIYEHT